MKKGIKKGEELIDINFLTPNPLNPFPHSGDEAFGKLYESVVGNPNWLEYNKIVYDSEAEIQNMILSGNKRWRCLMLAGYKKIPKRWVIAVEDMGEDEKRALSIVINTHIGKWDKKVLSLPEYKALPLEKYLPELDLVPKKAEVVRDRVFGEALDFASNYIVLKFDKDVDFLQAKELLGIESVHSKRQNGKPWSKGIGRVIDGVGAIQKLKGN